MAEPTAPPTHVVAGFGVGGVTPICLPSNAGRAWRFGDLVLQPAPDPVLTAWTAGVFESLRVSGIRIPRPIRSLDGRWVVGGWCAQRFVSGRPAPRFDDAIEASLALDAALRDIPIPRMLTESLGLTGWADRLSWDPAADAKGRLGGSTAATLWFQLAAGRRPVTGSVQVLHADLFGHVLFAGSAPPAVVAFRPLVGPPGLSAAIFVVDAVAWGGAPAELGEGDPRIDQWPLLLRRACLSRLAYTLSHPRSNEDAVNRVMAGVTSLRPYMNA